MIRNTDIVSDAARRLWRRAVLPLMLRWAGRDADYYDKTPHVCFKAAFASEANADIELPRILETHLHARCESFRRIKWWFFIRWVCLIQMGQSKFSVLCDRSRYADNEWILLIGPLGTQANNSRELVNVCREIHASLGTIAGITAVRWYFKGLHGQSEVGVATPDELPWTQA